MNCPISNRTARLLTILPLCTCLILASVSLAQQPPANNTPNSQQKPPPPTPEALELNRLNIEGAKAYNRGDFPAALKAFQSGLEKAQAIKDERGTAIFLNNIGNVYSDLGQNEKALDFFQRSLTLSEKSGNQQDIAINLNGIGAVYADLGQYEKALDFYQRALTLKEKIGNKQDIASSLNNIGAVYADLGQYEKALDFYQRALILREKIGNKQDIAGSLSSIGNVYANLGQNEKALDFHQRALTLREKSGNEQNIARSLNNIGVVYDSLGQTEKALDYYQRALTLREKIGNPQDIAYSLNNIGVVYRSLGQNEKALDFLQRALTLNEKIGNKQDIASSLNNIGAVYADLGQTEKALDFLQRALTLREKSGNEQEIAASLNNIGVVYWSLGQKEKALEFHQRSLTLREKIGNPQDIAGSLNNIGNVYSSLGQKEKALDFYQRTLTLYEKVSEQVSEASELGKFQKTTVNIYSSYADLLLTLKRPNEAFVMLERGQGQGLYRKAQQNRVGLANLLKTEDADRLNTLTTEFTVASRQYQLLLKRRQADNPQKLNAYGKALLDAKERRSRAERDLTLLRETLFTKYPKFKKLQGLEKRLVSDFLRLSKQNPDTLYLEYAPLDDNKTLLCLLLGGKITFLRLPFGEKQLATLVPNWQEAIRGYSPEGKIEKRKEELPLAKRLSALLFAPVERAILQKTKQPPTHLVVVGSGYLMDIPFSVLLDSKGRRLVERFALSCAFSLSSLLWKEEARPSPGTLFAVADTEGKQEVVMGKPVQLASLRDRGGPLQHAREETEAVRSLFSPSYVLMGGKGREAEVKQEMPKYRLLHFAVHSEANSGRGLQSSLHLAPEPQGSKEDGLLEAREITEMQLTARLAVLSACETGQGAKSGGDGLIGLAWAFRVARVPAIVASQWKVDDTATKELMIGFYRGLKAGKRKDDALRDAMLSVKKGKVPPYFWAAFQVIGKADPVR